MYTVTSYLHLTLLAEMEEKRKNPDGERRFPKVLPLRRAPMHQLCQQEQSDDTVRSMLDPQSDARRCGSVYQYRTVLVVRCYRFALAPVARQGRFFSLACAFVVRGCGPCLAYVHVVEYALVTSIRTLDDAYSPARTVESKKQYI